MKRSKSKGGHQVRLRNKCGTCYILRANNLLRDPKADKRLTQLISQRIEATPFKWCLYLEEKISISGILLRKLISRWSPDGGGFRVGTRVIHFTPLDVCFALGLCISGEPVERNEEAESQTRALFVDDRITLEVIYENLELCMNEGRVDDFCRLYIILAFADFYFPNTSDFVNMSMFRLLDELDSLHRYNWGMAVHDNLVFSLNRAAKNFNESKNSEDLWVSGCVAVLQVWAVEHLQMRPTNTMHHIKFPRVLSKVHLGIKKRLITCAFDINNVQENLVISNEDRDYDVLREALALTKDGFCEIPNPSFVVEGCHCGYQVLEEENRQLKEQVVRLEKDVVFIKEILREQGLCNILMIKLHQNYLENLP
ncbi:protein MAINTENANCE OF MERISTEMS-like [Lotus japonicus]|uniref:protein MAINTENANCE OF MERISTEMS-like n=1 Tax=Lotus japonicus TaxID=34305 RepID=UPI002583A669|nr:protein MAINTENANCE OF MERISTEMS-like [Lotus japonicus]